jgi:hypothetical protein
LLAIDTAGKTTYYQATHQHYNITWIKKNGSITFIIMNISMSDAGDYTLEIRRVGYVDLEKRVNVVVHRAGLMLIILFTNLESTSVHGLHSIQYIYTN